MDGKDLRSLIKALADAKDLEDIMMSGSAEESVRAMQERYYAYFSFFFAVRVVFRIARGARAGGRWLSI